MLATIIKLANPIDGVVPVINLHLSKQTLYGVSPFGARLRGDQPDILEVDSERTVLNISLFLARRSLGVVFNSEQPVHRLASSNIR